MPGIAGLIKVWGYLILTHATIRKRRGKWVQARLYPATGAGRQAAFGAETVSSPLLVYPVPAQSTVWVRYDARMTGTATIQLINPAGQSVSQTSHAVTPGENLIRLDVNALNRGSYVLMLIDGNQRETRKLILTE
ncbi:MAG: T9SS type A sorting domain-containing protein [Cytophagaceae bacterium]|nr:MAG: T9SS type A sorting domain-containing protein [Cytophagaceae bacterium]